MLWGVRKNFKCQIPGGHPNHRKQKRSIFGPKLENSFALGPPEHFGPQHDEKILNFTNFEKF